MLEYCKSRYTTPITYLDEPKQQLRTKRAKLDHVVIAAAIRQWHRHWVQMCAISIFSFTR